MMQVPNLRAHILVNSIHLRRIV